MFAYFFSKVTLPWGIVLAFGEIRTDNYVMGNVPYWTVAAKLAVTPARGTARSSFMQERRGSALGLGTVCVPAGWPGAAHWGGMGRAATVVPAGSSPGQCHTWAFANARLFAACSAVISPCSPMPESALDGKAVKMVLLCLLFFPPPAPFFPNKHIAARGQLLFSRGDM